MFSSFTGVFGKLKQTKLVQNITTNVSKLRKQMNKKLQIVQIIPQLYHISYPQDDMLEDLKEHINGRDFQIWNIGQYKYSKEIEQKILQRGEDGEIHHLCFEYYSNLPLYELIIALNSIRYFIDLNPRHAVYVHCQDNKLRSCVFLACFVYKFNVLKASDISEAILFINKKLGTTIEVDHSGSETSNYKSEHIFFKNFVNYLNNPQIINPRKLQLLKILINDAPQLKIQNSVISAGKELKVCIQIRSRQEVILKANYDSAVFQGDSMCIELSNRTIILGDDFVVLIKYIFEGKVYSMMRIQLNTNFIFDKFVRAHQQFIDLSCFCQVNKKANMFIDFLFEENLSYSDLAKLQEMPKQQSIKIPKKHQAKQAEKKKQQQKIKAQQAQKQISEQHFSLHDHQDEQEHEVDEHEINRKIQEVMKKANEKQAQQQAEERVEAEAEQEEQQEDLDDYLSKLESQV